MALFSVVIIGRPRDLLGLIPGFLKEGGFKRFIIPSGVIVFPGIILQWLVKYSAPFYITAF